MLLLVLSTLLAPPGLGDWSAPDGTLPSHVPRRRRASKSKQMRDVRRMEEHCRRNFVRTLEHDCTGNTSKPDHDLSVPGSSDSTVLAHCGDSVQGAHYTCAPFETTCAFLQHGRFSLRARYSPCSDLGKRLVISELPLWEFRVPGKRPTATCRLRLTDFWEMDRLLRNASSERFWPPFPWNDCNLPPPTSCLCVLKEVIDAVLSVPEGLSFLLKLLHSTDLQASTPVVLSPCPSLSGVSEPKMKEDTMQIPPWLRDLCNNMSKMPTRFGAQLDLLSSKTLSANWGEHRGRWRELFPLPMATIENIIEFTPKSPLVLLPFVLMLTNSGLKGLSLLYGYNLNCSSKSPSASQLNVIKLTAGRSHRLLSRLIDLPNIPSENQALDKLINNSDGTTPIVAARCDLHPRAGCVDPIPLLSNKMRQVVSDPEKLFPHASLDLKHFPNIWGPSRREYVLLVARQLEAGKIALESEIRAGGTVFGRLKPNGAIRPIWHGSAVSAAALAPPKPRHLASPSALLHLETLPGQPYYLSKRDGRNMFDQLACPATLRQFFAQPGVSVRDLLDVAGCSWGFVRRHYVGKAPLYGSTRLWPVSRVWGMGFSWSSTIFQEVSLHCCETAGLPSRNILADDQKPPADLSRVHAVATDDVMMFNRVSRNASISDARAVDSSCTQAGVELNHVKDVDGSLKGTVIGVDLTDGRFLSANAEKLATYLLGGCALLQEPWATPNQLSAFLGQPHWQYQLNRPLYSVFHNVYKFTKKENGNLRQRFPPEVVGEIALSLMLAPWTEADLERPWAEHILATDASPSYGFGLCYAMASQKQARAIGHLASNHDVFVRPARDFDENSIEQPRVGACHRLPVRKSCFRTVIAARARHCAHAGALEAAAVSLTCKWLARSRRHHSRRHAILIDAKAVLGATNKGRTSALTLKREIARAAACSLACDLLLRCVYIPSESNPADAPSRGRTHQRPYRRAMQQSN